MKKKTVSMAACLIAATLMLAGSAYNTRAVVVEKPTAGVSSVLQEYIGTKKTEAVAAVAEAKREAEAEAEAQAMIEEKEVEAVQSPWENLAVAQVGNFVNIRSEANTDSEVLGKLYDGAVAEVLGTEGDWTYVTSGTVTGYIKSEFLAINNEGVFKANATRIATVNTETLFVREEPSTESSVVEYAGEGDQLKVLDELDGWIKVSVDGTEGYISSDYAECSYTYDVAESKAEEEARLAAEEAAKKAAQSRNTTTRSSGSYSYSAPSGSTGSSVADYALQFLGNPYVYGGSSLTNGTDCSGFVMSVYRAFGVSLPHSSYSLRSCGTGVDISSAQPGDVVCYSGHVGIYIGGGQIVHAATYGVGITISSVYYDTILSVRRIL